MRHQTDTVSQDMNPGMKPTTMIRSTATFMHEMRVLVHVSNSLPCMSL